MYCPNITTEEAAEMEWEVVPAISRRLIGVTQNTDREDTSILPALTVTEA